eukprot:Gregarina_sp_Pseudo_9__2971@NODE_3182_length_726_cov_605_187773_g2903_i0_p1_GENE_NODE_3182_length_726_cov_605_187773_g2903_i0NODE_3182_length_726_cov_605_187773_g2903_i0_p1_ORF_typecomplete_len182_score58_46TCTP/PF00838_17/2_2e30_NODE_3182_length_726_cov_605_187773_g2903_i097642
MVEVYTDKHSGKDVCSDAYMPLAPFGKDEYKLVAFEVKTRMKAKGGEDFGIAHNEDEDAEGGAGGAGGDSAVEKVVDLVDSFTLEQAGLDKKLFTSYWMNYVKQVLTVEQKAEDMAAWKAAINALSKDMLANFKDADIYFCEGAYDAADPTKVMPIYCYWKEGEETPRFIFFKDGLKSTKY